MKTLFRILIGLVVASSAPAGDVSIGAYYYPWYDKDGRHWDSGFQGESDGRSPALGKYSSRSKSTVSQHIQWSGNLGIDHWICSWWGPNSWEDETLLRHVLPLLKGDQKTPEFCILYETAGLLGLDPEVGIDFDLRGNSRRLAEHIHYLARNYFDHPAYLKIDGRPVVYLYLSRTFTGNYESGLTNARTVAESLGFQLFLVGDEVYWGEPDKKRISQFDAITSYNMHGPEVFSGLSDWSDFLHETASIYQNYKQIAGRLGVGFIPGVLPGFDSRDAGGDHYPIPRFLTDEPESKTTLDAFLELAGRQLDPALRTIAVTSFNEWHEGTQLEPFQSEQLLKSLKRRPTFPPGSN